MYQSDKTVYKEGMEIEEIRRIRLREAATRMGGPAKLAAKIDRSESQVSQLIGKNPTRNLRGKLAREFEDKLGLPKFWLDHLENTPSPAAVPASTPEPKPPAPFVQESSAPYDTADKELRVVIEQWPDLSMDKRRELAAEALIGAIPAPAKPPEGTPGTAANDDEKKHRWNLFHIRRPGKPPE